MLGAEREILSSGTGWRGFLAARAPRQNRSEGQQSAKKRLMKILLKNRLDAPDGGEYNPPPLTNGAAGKAARDGSGSPLKDWLSENWIEEEGNHK